MKGFTTTLFVLTLSTGATFGQGTIVLWDQSVNGPLSPNYQTPTILDPLQVGVDSITASTENVPMQYGWNSIPNYFIITVPDNMEVTSINLQIDTPDVWSWISSDGDQLGFSPNSEDGNLLSQWGMSSIGQGTYGMYMLNADDLTTPSTANYQLDFTVVPEPASICLFFFGFACLLTYRQARPQRY